MVLGRFVPIVRTYVPLAAGTAQMHYRRFLLFNLIGAISWACGLTSSACSRRHPARRAQHRRADDRHRPRLDPPDRHRRPPESARRPKRREAAAEASEPRGRRPATDE